MDVARGRGNNDLWRVRVKTLCGKSDALDRSGSEVERERGLALVEDVGASHGMGGDERVGTSGESCEGRVGEEGGGGSTGTVKIREIPNGGGRMLRAGEGGRAGGG